MTVKKAPVRLTELLVVVALVVGALIFAERAAWLQINRLRSSMTVEQLKTFRSADRVRAAVLDVRAAWRSENGPDDSARRENTDQRIAAAQRIIHEEAAAALNPAERELIKQLKVALNGYANVVTNASGANGGPRSIDADRALELLFGLTDRLAAQNESAAKRFVAEANASLTRLQRFLFVSLVALLVAGTVTVVFAYRRTITPLRNTLTESRAIIERQEKLASLGVLAAGIAHEIRNPLTAIKVRLFSLKASHPRGTSERDDTEVIESEIERLERIVRDFLQFARPSEPVLETMHSAKLLKDTGELLSSELAKRSIRLKIEIEDDEPVNVDPDKMKQVLINFIHNGADSMDAEGIVTLRSRVDKQALNGRVVPVVVLDIKDSGKGMPPEVRKRLFDPFFTTKEKGTGLGLPISARIVEKHGGVIQYVTQPGRGTTFSIVLPLAETNENGS